MALQVDVDPLDALDLFYDGEKLGVPKNAFVQLKQKRGLVLPAKLQVFLRNYGYLDINRDAYRVLLPEDMEPVQIECLDEEVNEGWVIAETPHGYLAVAAKDQELDNPDLYLSNGPREVDGGKVWDFEPSMWTLRKLLTAIFVDSPAARGCTTICDDPKEMQSVIIEYDKELDVSQKKLVDVFETSKRPGQYICWDTEERKFIIVVLTLKRDFLARFPIRMSIQELELIFTTEFLDGRVELDYKHALKLLKRIITFYEGEKNEAAAIKLGRYYKLAGFCCWKMKMQRSAEKWYKKAQKTTEQNLSAALDSCRALYENLGKFNLELGESESSQKAFDRAKQLRDFAEAYDPRKKGERLMEAAIKANNDGDYQAAIELCDKALVELEKEPKGCKYDIARCRQIRGDARKNLRNTIQK